MFFFLGESNVFIFLVSLGFRIGFCIKRVFKEFLRKVGWGSLDVVGRVGFVLWFVGICLKF